MEGEGPGVCVDKNCCCPPSMPPTPWEEGERETPGVGLLKVVGVSRSGGDGKDETVEPPALLFSPPSRRGEEEGRGDDVKEDESVGREEEVADRDPAWGVGVGVKVPPPS